ncbi:uncharacterized protein [Rutidosis leptorrhynchoides]|uniref:uncharacterized protein n=1 Tax=Rutidosis leptorrhynchoides TaxID=125765 RepID=UPI003A99CCB1
MAKRRRRTSSITSTSSSSTSTSSCRSTALQHSNPQIVFGTLLAALCSNKPASERNLVIQKTLNHLLTCLLSKSSNSILQSQQTLHIPIISLLPVIINCKCLEIACSGLEIVGAASLYSIEMNERIASDDEIVKGLITAESSSRRSVSMAACNAILDLFTTSIGRSKLLEFHAIENLMSLNLQPLQYL